MSQPDQAEEEALPTVGWSDVGHFLDHPLSSIAVLLMVGMARFARYLLGWPAKAPSAPSRSWLIVTVAALVTFFGGGSLVCWVVQFVLPWFGKDNTASLVFLVAWVPASLYLGYRCAGWCHAWGAPADESGATGGRRISGTSRRLRAGDGSFDRRVNSSVRRSQAMELQAPAERAMARDKQEALLDAIRADPRNRDPRDALAEHWGDRPEGELIRILLAFQPPSGMDAMQNWFGRHADWPEIVTDENGEVSARALMRPLKWLGHAFDPAGWPDAGWQRSAVLAVVRHILPDAQHFLPTDDPDRANLEEIETVLTADPPRAARVRLTWVGSSQSLETVGPQSSALARSALFSARRAYVSLAALPFDLRSEVANEELARQYLILGWAWLGLPPLIADRGLRHLEPSRFSPSDLASRGCLVFVLASPLIVLGSIWINSPPPHDLRSFLQALGITALFPLAAVLMVGVFALLHLAGRSRAVGLGVALVLILAVVVTILQQ